MVCQRDWLGELSSNLKEKMTGKAIVDNLCMMLSQAQTKDYKDERFIPIVEKLIGDKPLNKHIDDEGVSKILTTSARYSPLKVFKHLIELADNNPKYFTIPNGNNVLHYATWDGSLEKVKYLVEEWDISPNITNMFGETPLHFAFSEVTDTWFVQGKMTELIRVADYLLERGAKLNTPDRNGETPIDTLVREGIEDIPGHIDSGMPEKILIQVVKRVINLLNHLIQQGWLKQDELNKYIPEIEEVLTDPGVEAHKKLRDEILKFPATKPLV